MSTRGTGKAWEAAVAAEMQWLWDRRRAMLARVPTHYAGGHPSRDPKVDYVGLLDGGRMVAVECKSGQGRVTPQQRAYLAAVAELGGIAIVYSTVQGTRHVQRVDATGAMPRRGKATVCKSPTWLDFLEKEDEK